MSSSPSSSASPHTILLWDVMSTLVYDPYMQELPAFFDTTWQDLLSRKHPTAWVDFELGKLTEQEFFDIFLPDLDTPIALDAFHAMLHDAYRFLPGIEELLEELCGLDGLAMHTLSNYPVWYRIIERKLALSRFMPWSFVSCHMGARKPDVSIYLQAARALEVPPSQCVFIDDRGSNCKAALAAGMRAIKYDGSAETLRAEILAMLHEPGRVAK